MMRPSLNDLAAFASVAKHRSFRKAAEAMGVSRSTLSHSLIGLERNLGIRLLNRTTRSVSLTEGGARLLEYLGPMLANLDAVLDSLSEVRGTPSGTLRINANKSGAAMLVRGVIPQFLTRYPQVEIDLVTEGRLVDIVDQGFDAGVRLADAVPQDMIAIRFGGDIRFIAVASPDYLSGRDRPTTPDDLRRHRCIRQRLPSGKRYRWEFAQHGEEIEIDAPGALTLDDNDLIAEAAADGLGIAYVPESVVRKLLDLERLVIVLEDWCPLMPGLALYYPHNRHVPSTLRAFIDTLKEVNWVDAAKDIGPDRRRGIASPAPP